MSVVYASLQSPDWCIMCLQGCSYSCVVATPDSRALYVVGSDKKLKELEEVGGTGTQVTKELDTGAVINSIALPAGTASAAVHMILFPGLSEGCQSSKTAASLNSRLSDAQLSVPFSCTKPACKWAADFGSAHYPLKPDCSPTSMPPPPPLALGKPPKST